MEGYVKRASLFAGALLGELLSGEPEGHGEEGSGEGHHPMGGPFTGTSDSCKRALETEHLYGSSVRGIWRGGSFSRGPEGYERKALGMGISLYGGSVGQPGVGSSTGDFEIWLKGALEGGPLAGDPEGYVEKALEIGISFHRGPVWGTWRRARVKLHGRSYRKTVRHFVSKERLGKMCTASRSEFSIVLLLRQKSSMKMHVSDVQNGKYFFFVTKFVSLFMRIHLLKHVTCEYLSTLHSSKYM